MDNLGGTLLEILKYTIPGLVVATACYLIVNRFLNTQIQNSRMELLKETQDVTLRLRLQAYERLVLFVERITPRQIIPRLYDSGMTVRDLQQMVSQSINSEFEHNLAQQIYVSPNVWDTVKSVKEQQLAMVNHLAQTLHPDAPARELHVRILEVIQKAGEEELPTDMATRIIKAEAAKILSYGSL